MDNEAVLTPATSHIMEYGSNKHKIITKLPQDGVKHDPRNIFDSIRIILKWKDGRPQDSVHGSPRVWNALLAGDNVMAPKPRSGGKANGIFRVCEDPKASDLKAYVVSDLTKVLLVFRKDGHNPFFQVAQALNTWMMMKILRWSATDTQLVYLDKAIPTAIDDLRHRLLAPTKTPVSAIDLPMHQNMASVRAGIVEFGNVMVAPFEKAGRLMRHLDDYEPCREHSSLRTFVRRH